MKKNKKQENTTKPSLGKVEKKKFSAGEISFGADRHRGGAITWFICALLLIPCFIETGIWAMIAMVPILVTLGVGFWRESRNNKVLIDNDTIIIHDGSGLRTRQETISGKKIVTALVDSSLEKDQEHIHSIQLITTTGRVKIPDVDEKEELLNQLKKIKPGLKAEKIS